MKTKLVAILFVLFSICTHTFAQAEIYIPYKKDRLWGFADTTGSIVLPTVYNAVREYKNGYFMVRNTKSWGIVNLQNQVIIDFFYEDISIEGDLFVVTRKRKKGVLNNKDKFILDLKYRTINAKPAYIQAYGGQEPGGYFNYEGEKLLPDGLMVRKIFDFENETYVIFKNSSNKAGLARLSKKGKGIEKIIIDTGYYKHIKISNELEHIALEENIPRSRYYCKFVDILKGKISHRNLKKKGTLVYKIRGKNVKADKQYTELFRNPSPLFQKVNDSKSINYWEIENATYFEMDTIKNDKNYQLVIQKISYGNDFPRIVLHRDTILSSYPNVSFIYLGNSKSCNQVCLSFYEVYDTLQANLAIVPNETGLKGIVDTKQKMLIPFEYDEIKTNYFIEQCEKLLLICKKGEKWGMINMSNKTVINFNYDEIIYHYYDSRSYQECFNLDKGFITKKDGKYGVINAQEQELAPFIFDQIDFNKSENSFTLKKGDKYGLLDNGVYIPAKYDLRISKIININGYDVYKTNSDNRFVDPKGFPYFEWNNRR